MSVRPPGVCSYRMEVMTDQDFMPFVAASVQQPMHIYSVQSSPVL